MAAMFHDRNNEDICIRINIFPHRKKNLLFLPCSMAVVQNPYCRMVLALVQIFILEYVIIQIFLV